MLSVSSSLNTFTLKSYDELAKGEGNLVLSPFNIASVLSMLLLGARGKTAEEIRSVLHISESSDYHASLSTLLTDLLNAGNLSDNQLLTGNAIWLQNGLLIEPHFVENLAEFYRGQLTPLDFAANSEAARRQINGFVENQTKGRISDLLPVGSVDSDTSLVLTSAIYFFGAWQQPFESFATRPEAFHVSSGKTLEVDFMHQTKKLSYAETDEVQILEMNYEGTGITFDALLPRAMEGLSDLERTISQDTLDRLLKQVSLRNVEVSLPKFRIEFSVEMSDKLSKMGMADSFKDSADFSGIDVSGEGLKISKVLHKAFVDVTEQGTEAAAATAAILERRFRPPPNDPVVFRADHPFLFLIRDARSGVILFIGRWLGPS